MDNLEKISKLVLTINGWVEFNSLIIGDEIITPNGSISKIIEIVNTNISYTYKLTFTDGREIYCSNKQLYKIHHFDYTDRFKLLTIEELIKKFNGKSGNRIRIELIDFQNETEKELIIDPYVLGCLIGDGGMTQKSISFTTADTFIYEKIKNRIEKDGIRIIKIKTKYGYYISREMYEKLKILNLYGKKSEFKFIPNEYKNISYKQKLELLNGLIDTDGSVTKNGSVQFYSSSYQLIKDVQELIWSIGGIAKIKTKLITKFKDNNGNDKFGLTSYKLYIRFHDPKRLVSLPRKLERLSETYQYADLKLRLENIELIDTKFKSRRLILDDNDQLFISNNYVVQHC